MANFCLLSLLFASLLLSSQTLLNFCHAEGGPEVDTKSRVVISEDKSPFSYKEEAANGPKQWGSINSTWKVCGDGKFQSPIDVPERKLAVPGDLGRLRRNYKPAPAQLVNRGHDISDVFGNTLLFAMEVHMVHMTPNHGVAVVGILYKFGRPDPFLANVTRLNSVVFHCPIIWLTMLPTSFVRTVSREQLSALRNAVHDGFEVNARPVQALAGRQVYLYAGQ
ncbi:hypothetical protein RJ640_000749 [Escallonia rubra]|uniref:Alpha-carbonic anhydrase domain-containing protein n=1 Tax=Escallonia rubra TaxID=112253 RepID=A0AA88R3T9_9ASTE|nr:hypothetical protein RJ640_000749 [Escallonia rubra]